MLGSAVVKSHFGGARDWGLMMTTASIGSVVAGVFVLRVRPRRPMRLTYTIGFVMPIGLVIVGPIAASIGVETTLVVAAALGAASLAGAPAVPEFRDLERLDVEAETPEETATATG